jgi:high affinity sulfate transporter 1
VPQRWPRLVHIVPLLRWLPDYRATSLWGDLQAGCIVAALLVPQALGYARIAGVPVEVGLYAVPIALLAYAVLGSSRQLIVGPASTVAIVSGSLVADISRGDASQAVALTAALAIASGLVLLVIGVLRVGWVAEFLSKPIVTGFVFGLTLTIIVGELPTLLGIDKPEGDFVGVAVGTLRNITDMDLRTAAAGGVALIVLVVGARFVPRVPWGLVTLVFGVVLSTLLDLSAKGVQTVGEVPAGLPPLRLPGIEASEIGPVLVGGVSLALVALAEGLAAARLFAIRGGYHVETERELVALGASNVAAGLTGGLGVTGSLSKTAAGANAGGRSQVTGLAAGVLVIAVLVAFTWFFTELPRSVLAAIVIAAVWGLMDVAALRRYARIRRADFVAAVVCGAAVVLFGPLPGLGIAIAVSLLAIIYRASRPRIEVLGKISEEKAAWGRVRGHPDRRPVHGVVVVRLDAPLFWANASAIEERLLEEIDRWPDTRALVIDLEATTQLDTTSVDVLAHLLHELGERGVELYLARVLHPAMKVLERSGFIELLGEDHTWHSISQCVRAARRHTGLKGHRRHAAAATDDVSEEHLATGVDWVDEVEHLDDDAGNDQGMEVEVLDEDDQPSGSNGS